MFIYFICTALIRWKVYIDKFTKDFKYILGITTILFYVVII